MGSARESAVRFERQRRLTLLSLETNLDDLHWVYDQDSLSSTGAETSNENVGRRELSVNVRKPVLVLCEIKSAHDARALWVYSRSNEANRIAILGTIPVTTAPRPL